MALRQQDGAVRADLTSSAVEAALGEKTNGEPWPPNKHNTPMLETAFRVVGVIARIISHVIEA
jgi:hypothetical protein